MFGIKTKPAEDKTNFPDSYRLTYSLGIDWKLLFADSRIKKICGIPEGQTLKEVPRDLEASSLLGRGIWNFSFFEFGDNISGLRQTWSSYDKSLVEHPHIVCTAAGFGEADEVQICGEHDNLQVLFGDAEDETDVLTEMKVPHFQGTGWVPDYPPNYAAVLASFPIGAIRDLLLDVIASVSDPALAQKGLASLPPEFEKYLKSRGVTYSHETSEGHQPEQVEVETAQGKLVIDKRSDNHFRHFNMGYASLAIKMQPFWGKKIRR